MGGRRRVTAAEGGWATRALQRRISFSSTVVLERGWVWIGILIEPAAKQSLATYRQFSIRAHLTFSPTSGPTRVLDEANILALEDNTLSHRASTSVLGKRFVGMRTDVQTKANSVPSRSDAVGSMIQPLTSSDGYTGRAVK